MKRYYLFLLVLACAPFPMGAGAQGLPAGPFGGAGLSVSPAGQVNTAASDICPFFVGGELYFSSVREGHPGRGKRKAFYGMYCAPVGEGGQLGATRSPVPGFGEKYHEGPASYCGATGELFATVSNVDGPELLRGIIPVKKIRLKIVAMKKSGGAWSVSQEMPFTDGRYNFAHPAISKGGDTLVFSSDMVANSMGGNDLYMSVRKGGQWSAPVNLGSGINTPGDEMYPSFVGGGLAFSSDGRGGKGGLDIYWAPSPGGGAPVALGGEANSAGDDFGLCTAPGGQAAYLTSDRAGGAGSDDIYLVDVRTPEVAFEGEVRYDAGDGPAKGATVELRGCGGGPIKTAQTGADGKFYFSCAPGGPWTLEAKKEGYDSNKETLKKAASGIGLRLWQFREVSVFDAEDMAPLPGVRFTCGGESMGETGRSGCLSMEPPYPYGKKIEISKDGYLDNSFVMERPKVAKSVMRDTVLLEVVLYKKEINKAFVLENIYYGLDKWDILPESAKELDKLAKIMKDNPGIRVELGSHTDSRGTKAYNLELSQKRSSSATAYIIGKGIGRQRIVAKGYGESQPVNRCRDGVACTEEGHRENRRTEFKLIGL